MTTELSNFAARLREHISLFSDVAADVRRLTIFKPSTLNPQPSARIEPPHVGCHENEFNTLALELFALQFRHNAAYRKICAARGLTPKVVEHWTQIPHVPTAAFKELELSSIPPAERTAVFHSSGTTEQKPSRHYHSAESLKIYEASLLPWFLKNVLPDLRFTIYDLRLVCLTPPPEQAPHSSLVHMFETVRQKLGGASSLSRSAAISTSRAFLGGIAADGSWTLDFDAVVDVLSSVCSDSRSGQGDKAQTDSKKREVRASSRRLLHVPRAANPVHVLGTAFSFVHLLDFLANRNLRFNLPAGSRVMETGGYKNRSRSMPKTELHQLITERLGVPPSQIICEYGMSELSSQAYDGTIQANDLNLPHPGPLPKERENCRQSAGKSVVGGKSKERTLLFLLPEGEGQGEGKRAVKTHYFHFPPWARVQIISPETGHEVADGETGLIRVFDLANVFSVMAIQTEDLGVRRGDGFELIGRAVLAEARGCSLMTI